MSMRIAALFTLLLASAAGSLWPATARADDNEVFKLVTAELVVTALHNAGARRFSTSIDSLGDPQIEAETDGLSFDVLFYDCEDEACQKVPFRVEFQDDETTAEEARGMMGKWNREWVFGKAYIDDDGNMTLEHAIYARDGVTRANLQRNADLWVELVEDFSAAIGW